MAGKKMAKVEISADCRRQAIRAGHPGLGTDPSAWQGAFTAISRVPRREKGSMSRASAFTVRIKRSAEWEMDRLPGDVFERVSEAILGLEQIPRPTGCKKLRGAQAYRLRVGSYRILYTIDDGQRAVEVVAVGHRRTYIAACRSPLRPVACEWLS
jgi:mRNA interferase RelE/StbE